MNLKKLKSHKREELVLFIILGVMYSKYIKKLLIHKFFQKK